MKPTIGRIVHFIAPASEGGLTYAAIVTEVGADGAGDKIGLCTFGPGSLYFHHAVPEIGPGQYGGWRWPPREPPAVAVAPPPAAPAAP